MQMLNDNTFAQMNRLRSELEKVFGVDIKNYGSTQLHPRVNMREDSKRIFLEAELPGVRLEDIEILILEGDQLSIKGNRRKPETQTNEWMRNERIFGEFARTFTLSCAVDVERVNATMKNGILEIVLPKSPAHQPRKISIHAGE
jgi:HSP20 family protein